MGANFSNAQKLVMAVEEYERLLGLEGYNLYARLKKKWRVKSVTEKSEEWIIEKLKTYQAGINGLKSHEISENNELRRYLLDFSTKLRKPTKKKKAD